MREGGEDGQGVGVVGEGQESKGGGSLERGKEILGEPRLARRGSEYAGVYIWSV